MLFIFFDIRMTIQLKTNKDTSMNTIKTMIIMLILASLLYSYNSKDINNFTMLIIHQAII